MVIGFAGHQGMQRHRHWLAVLLCACICHAVDVHTVHLTFSHHLDVGLDLPGKQVANCVGFATKIVQRYFDEFIPRAIRLARETSGNRSSAGASSTSRHSFTSLSWRMALTGNSGVVSPGRTIRPGLRPGGRV